VPKKPKERLVIAGTAACDFDDFLNSAFSRLEALNQELRGFHADLVRVEELLSGLRKAVNDFRSGVSVREVPSG